MIQPYDDHCLLFFLSNYIGKKILRRAVQQNRHGAGVNNVHLHHGSENTGAYLDAFGAKQFDKCIIQRFRNHRPCRLDETGPASFANIPIQRKLRDGENFTSRFQKRNIHLAVSVLKNTQVHTFVSPERQLVLSVTFFETDQQDHTLTDFSDYIIFYGYTRAAYALNNYSQSLSTPLVVMIISKSLLSALNFFPQMPLIYADTAKSVGDEFIVSH